MITAAQFQDYATQGFNRIPVVHEVLSDLDTPLSAYLKLASGACSYLFESVEGGARWGRYSIIGMPARTVLKVYGYRLLLEENGAIVRDEIVADPLAEIEKIKQAIRVPVLPDLPKFHGGWVGYFGYECAQYIESKLQTKQNQDQLGMPDIYLMLAEELAVFDNLKGKIYLIVNANPEQDNAYENAVQRLETLVHQLRETAVTYPRLQEPTAIDESHFISSFPKEKYLQAVQQCKEYVYSGDVFQVQISQR
ncbi:MAG: anthranilate synthase component I, partial [Arenimonas sp.]|nr:anthranilate synthase component I [Arenimonas sp.]